jgi:hypothetical protein
MSLSLRFVSLTCINSKIGLIRLLQIVCSSLPLSYPRGRYVEGASRLVVYTPTMVFKSKMFIWNILHGVNEELKKFMRLDVHSYHTRNLHNFQCMHTQNNTGKVRFCKWFEDLQWHSWGYQYPVLNSHPFVTTVIPCYGINLFRANFERVSDLQMVKFTN